MAAVISYYLTTTNNFLYLITSHRIASIRILRRIPEGYPKDARRIYEGYIKYKKPQLQGYHCRARHYQMAAQFDKKKCKFRPDPQKLGHPPKIGGQSPLKILLNSCLESGIVIHAGAFYADEAIIIRTNWLLPAILI